MTQAMTQNHYKNMTNICPKCNGYKYRYSKNCIKCYKPSLNFGKYAEKGVIPWNIKKKPSYRSIHMWVQLHKGKPDKCSKCNCIGDKHRMHWVNISGKYKRELDDWIRLCSKCHGRYDKENGLRLRKNITKNKSKLTKSIS